MREMIHMVVVLTVLSAFSGGLLAALRESTQEQIEVQQLQFVKGPAIGAILKGATNNPISDRFKLKDGEVERSFFVGVLNGKPSALVFETSGKGFGGDVGVMVGVDTVENKMIGIGVTTHSETPGMGSKAKDDPAFGNQFKGLALDKPVKVTSDGGSINAISGATITSRAVSTAAGEAAATYARLKPQLTEQLKTFAK